MVLAAPQAQFLVLKNSSVGCIWEKHFEEGVVCRIFFVVDINMILMHMEAKLLESFSRFSQTFGVLCLTLSSMIHLELILWSL